MGSWLHSRLPYVQFVWTQDQQSFVSSFVSTWHYYGGTTEFAFLDNLKSGVEKPDLWDPQINRGLAEAAEHYGVFIDPCRVARSTDTGKIERFVPVTPERQPGRAQRPRAPLVPRGVRRQGAWYHQCGADGGVRAGAG